MLQIPRASAGVFAAMLPRRYWPALDEYVPASGCAFVAGILTLIVGATIGVTGFILFATDQVSMNNRALVNNVDPMAITRYMMWAMNGLMLFTFLFLTWQGWAFMYLTTSGFLRTIGAVYDDPHGDFILTLVDAGTRKVWGKIERRGEIDNRRLLEGPEVRDRIVRGAHIGLPRADLVIIASRIKEGWSPDTVVLTGTGEYRILAWEDRTIDGRLRRLYSLAQHKDLEVFRRTVRYEFPAVPSSGFPVPGSVVPASENEEPEPGTSRTRNLEPGT